LFEVVEEDVVRMDLGCFRETSLMSQVMKRDVCVTIEGIPRRLSLERWCMDECNSEIPSLGLYVCMCFVVTKGLEEE
jgi:hypothetical protein